MINDTYGGVIQQTSGACAEDRVLRILYYS